MKIAADIESTNDVMDPIRPHAIMIWFLVFTIMFANVSPEKSSSPEVINIGAILTFSTTTGRVAKIAMKAAEDDINSSPTILNGLRLSLSMRETNYSGFLDILGAIKFMETDTVAIIGPQSSEMAHVISHIANELHVPLLSFTALDPTLSPLQYPYFIQTAPNDGFQMTAIADIVSYFRWREIIALFSADDHNRNGIAALRHELTERRCKISYMAVLPLDSMTTRDDVLLQLQKISTMVSSRVIVVHTYSRSGLLVFDTAKSLNMTGEGFVWIATTWLTSVLDAGVPALSPAIASSIVGTLSLRVHTPESPRKKDFTARWPLLSNSSVGLNAFGLYAYDTVWTLAGALQQYLNGNGVVSFSNLTIDGLAGGILNLTALSRFDGGEDMIRHILQTNRVGLSGRIQFDEDRALVFPAYDVINILSTGRRVIGHWSNYSGLSVESPEILYRTPPNRSIANQRLGRVIWPGKTSEKPRGWVFSNAGRPLMVGVPDRVSFRDFVSGKKNRVHGYCIDVFEAAIKLLPYSVPYRFVLFGDGAKNPNYSELVRRVASNVFGAAVGDIAIVTSRTKIVDFTQPYTDSGLVVVAAVRRSGSSAWVFVQPFTPWMWIVSISSFIFIGAVVWILEHRLNDEFRGPPKKQLITILWFGLSTLFFSHRENTVSTLGRMVLLIWLFVVLIISSSYTASLTSILTVQQLSSPIKGIDSLLAGVDRIGFQIGSFAENYMIDDLNIPKWRLLPLGSPEEYAAALETGTVAAVVDERPYVELFLSRYCKFTTVGQEFTKSGWGFAFPRDSPLTVDMSTAILKLSENGELQRIRDRWIRQGGSCTPAASGGEVQLQWQSLWGLFLVCGVICALALFIYFCIIVRQFQRRRHRRPEDLRDDDSAVCDGGGSSLRSFFSFVDERKTESGTRRKRKRPSQSSANSSINGIVMAGEEKP